MVDIREPKIIDFAQLSLDIYDDPEYADLKSGYSTNWSRVCFKSNPISGFFAALYMNKSTNIGVISIRGTSNTPDKIADIKFVVYRGVQEQYAEIKDYINFLKNSVIYKNINIKYCCGHSLGGILAKAIAPVSELDTIAFNSSGVKAFLIQNNLKSNVKTDQTIITYTANGDLVGNFRTYEDTTKSYKFDVSEDFGKHIYVPVNGDTDNSKIIIKAQHSMKNLYLFFKNNKDYVYAK